MSILLALLVGVSVAAGLLLLGVSRSYVRDPLVLAASALVTMLSVATALSLGGDDARFLGAPEGWPVASALVALEVGLGLVVIVAGLRARRPLAPLMAAAQVGLALWLELTAGPEVASGRLLWVDRLSAVMLLVIGIVGPLICVHALGYMRDYQRAHPRVAGSRRTFFGVLFLFLGAMAGLVVANDLRLMLVCWEATTICSFLLIGYTGTHEARRAAFRALEINVAGGLAFSVAIALLSTRPDGLDLARLTASPASSALAPAIALLAVAGLTKSAQLPFSSWLLGAMQAPSPTSALLHSSTMVKAGVFLLLRLAPAIGGGLIGDLVGAVGLGTFLCVSAVAATERNTKRVLAYSTIATLGLIAACAGVGTPVAVWVGVLLIVFHATAKGLLFLVVGSLENRLYTKDMEHFDALLSRFPRLSVLALTGIAGMVVAPFGLVVAKWAAIHAFLEVPGILGALDVIALAFGSSLTLFTWGKLLLKILSMRSIPEEERGLEQRVTRSEWFAEGALAIAVVALAGGVGLISERVAGPYVGSVFGVAPHPFATLAPEIVVGLLVAVAALPLLAVRAARHGSYDLADIYVSGRSVSSGHVVAGALGSSRPIALRNYYLAGILDGPRLLRFGTVAAAALTLALVVWPAVLA
ncbi:MAG TPA: proton-conducting transporter membrane subunit [Candidatus Dormibacteraeota bacterium]|nr:proton-conducting transporter membrane subunit [Candidatus Dormibacteraeota bacterium]